jgi:hypothetical protein
VNEILDRLTLRAISLAGQLVTLPLALIGHRRR